MKDALTLGVELKAQEKEAREYRIARALKGDTGIHKSQRRRWFPGVVHLSRPQSRCTAFETIYLAHCENRSEGSGFVSGCVASRLPSLSRDSTSE